MPDLEPAWLRDYIAPRIERLLSSPLDDLVRGELRGALETATLAGAVPAAWAKAHMDALPHITTAAGSYRATTGDGHQNLEEGGAVQRPAPLHSAARDPVVVDALLGKFLGGPLRVLLVRAEDRQMTVALCAVPRGQPRASGREQLSLIEALSRRIALRDDVGTTYQIAGHSSGGGLSVLCAELRFSPSTPAAATTLFVALLDDSQEVIGQIQLHTGSEAWPIG
jgi:hypothetical protein